MTEQPLVRELRLVERVLLQKQLTQSNLADFQLQLTKNSNLECALCILVRPFLDINIIHIRLQPQLDKALYLYLLMCQLHPATP